MIRIAVRHSPTMHLDVESTVNPGIKWHSIFLIALTTLRYVEPEGVRLKFNPSQPCIVRLGRLSYLVACSMG